MLHSRKIKSETRINGETSDSDDDDDPSPAIRDLAKALLQVCQGIDSKYLGSPLGKCFSPDFAIGFVLNMNVTPK